MSILSSTKAGVRAYKITRDDLMKRGYISNADGTRFFYQGKHHKHLTLEVAKNEIEKEFVYYISNKGLVHRIPVNNFPVLNAVEAIFNVQKGNVKEFEKYKKRLLKLVNKMK